MIRAPHPPSPVLLLSLSLAFSCPSPVPSVILLSISFPSPVPSVLLLSFSCPSPLLLCLCGSSFGAKHSLDDTQPRGQLHWRPRCRALAAALKRNRVGFLVLTISCESQGPERCAITCTKMDGSLMVFADLEPQQTVEFLRDTIGA